MAIPARLARCVGEVCLVPSIKPVGFSITSKGRYDTGPVHPTHRCQKCMELRRKHENVSGSSKDPFQASLQSTWKKGGTCREGENEQEREDLLQTWYFMRRRTCRACSHCPSFPYTSMSVL